MGKVWNAPNTARPEAYPEPHWLGIGQPDAVEWPDSPCCHASRIQHEHSTLITGPFGLEDLPRPR